MEKLERQTQKIFGGNAPADDLAALGSFKSGTPIYTDDIAMLQNEAYEQGYSAALVADEAPFLEEQNSVPYVLSKQLAYLFQTGIPEWDPNTTYYANTSFCQINGIIYQSLTDNNLGNNPATDNENWEIWGGAGSGASRNIGETVFSLLPLDDAGLHLLDGSLISGAGAYAGFIAKIAQLYGDGSNVPAYFTTEALWQQSVTNYGVCGKFVYDSTANTVRLPKVTGIVEGTLDANSLGELVQAALPALNSNGAHTHTRGTMEILGTLPNMVSNETSSGENGSFSWSRAGNNVGTGSSFNKLQVTFTGSKSWTGATSSNGTHTHTFSGNIGTSDTVQPQAVKGFLYIVIATSVKTDIEVDIDNIATDLNGKADTDLSNVSAIAESSAVAQQLATKLNQTQITNCLLEVPQRINLIDNGSNIIVPAGTVCIQPNGFEADGITPHFDYITTDEDFILENNQTTGTRLFGLNLKTKPYHLYRMQLADCYSGPTAPSSPVDNAMWYDTSTNLIKRYSSSSSSWSTNTYTFPLAVLNYTAVDVKPTINMIFNGFGYIGSTIWIDKDVKGLSPNGRNADGTCNNVEFTTARLIPYTFSSATVNFVMGFNSTSITIDNVDYYEQTSQPTAVNYVWYNPDTNELKQYADNTGFIDRTGNGVIALFGHRTNSKIDKLNIKQPFRAVDYNEFPALAAHAAMPSNRYNNLTLGADGSQYTAPADGWAYFETLPVTTIGYQAIINIANGMTVESRTSLTQTRCVIMLPIKKGDRFSVRYDTQGTRTFRFYYTEGAKND